MDALHDATMQRHRGVEWTVDRDVDIHAQWSSMRRGRALSDAELADLRKTHIDRLLTLPQRFGGRAVVTFRQTAIHTQGGNTVKCDRRSSL